VAVLVLAGTAVGLLLAAWGLTILRIGQLAIPLPVRFQPELDGGGLAFAVGAGVLAAILTAGAPLWFLGRLQPYQLVRDGIRGPSRNTMRKAMTGVQVALSALVLVKGVVSVGWCWVMSGGC